MTNPRPASLSPLSSATRSKKHRNEDETLPRDRDDSSITKYSSHNIRAPCRADWELSGEKGRFFIGSVPRNNEAPFSVLNKREITQKDNSELG
jgi:hypothetical protein